MCFEEANTTLNFQLFASMNRRLTRRLVCLGAADSVINMNSSVIMEANGFTLSKRRAVNVSR